MGNGLTVSSTTSLANASTLAKRTLAQIDELRASPIQMAAPAVPRRAAPTFASASSEDLTAAAEWMDRVGWADIGDAVIRLIGEVTVDLEYSHGDPMVTATPSLHALRALAAEARDLSAIWQRPAPIAELDSVAARAREALEAVANFHDEQVAIFARFTPRSFEDGSFERIAATYMPRYQPLIDEMVPSANALLGALAAAASQLDARLAGRRATR